MPPRPKGKFSVSLVVIIESKETLLEHGQLVLAIQEQSTSKKTILPSDQKVVVAVNEGGQLRVPFGMVVDYYAISECMAWPAQSLLRCKRIGLPSSCRCLGAERGESLVDVSFCQ